MRKATGSDKELWLLSRWGPGRPGVVDLGHDHYAKRFHVGRDEDRAVGGFAVLHPRGPNETGAYADSAWCLGSIQLDLPVNANYPHAKWHLEAWDPLTVSPSLLCNCGDHGFIKGGRWLPA